MTEQETVQAILNWLQARVARWNAIANTYEANARDLDVEAALVERERIAQMRVVAACDERVMEAIARGDWKGESNGG